MKRNTLAMLALCALNALILIPASRAQGQTANSATPLPADPRSRRWPRA